MATQSQAQAKAKRTAASSQKSRKRPKANAAPVDDILKIANNNPNLTHDQIAALVGCERSTVSKNLQRYGYDPEQTDDFKGRRADVFAWMQSRLLSSITDEDIKKAPLGSRILAVAQLYDKERLERGETTENIGVITATIRDIQNRRKQEGC